MQSSCTFSLTRWVDHCSADAATDGKGSEPADEEPGQGSAREPRRRAGEQAAKKPRAGGDAAAGQQIQAPPGLGLAAQNGLPERAPGQGPRKERYARGQSMMSDVLVSVLSNITFAVIWRDGLMLKEWCLHTYSC